MSYMHDPESNTHLVFYNQNPQMFDGKTEVADIALVRKSLEAFSEGAKVIVLSIPQLVKMSQPEAVEFLKQQGYETKEQNTAEVADEQVEVADEQVAAMDEQVAAMDETVETEELEEQEEKEE